MKKWWVLLFVLLVGSSSVHADLAAWLDYFFQSPTAASRPANDQAITQAYQQQLRDIQVQGQGRVTRVLADDKKGIRHQRFIINLANGHSLLIVHNIDLAPRINNLRVGDTVSFFGEYVWNKKGGLVHWTHHDPRGRHIGGWLEHQGQRYQ
ncbi:MAG: DUF3465 domain-containing protein [Aeromonadales bacterium]|nr:DUF3465 domain-containing protein [Aeromonadales bacterium]